MFLFFLKKIDSLNDKYQPPSVFFILYFNFNSLISLNQNLQNDHQIELEVFETYILLT